MKNFVPSGLFEKTIFVGNQDCRESAKKVKGFDSDIYTSYFPENKEENRTHEERL